MAEIRIRPKRRSLAWLWILLVVLIAAAVGWFLYMNNVTVFRAQQTGAALGRPALVAARGAHGTIDPGAVAARPIPSHSSREG